MRLRHFHAIALSVEERQGLAAAAVGAAAAEVAVGAVVVVVADGRDVNVGELVLKVFPVKRTSDLVFLLF